MEVIHDRWYPHRDRYDLAECPGLKIDQTQADTGDEHDVLVDDTGEENDRDQAIRSEALRHTVEISLSGCDGGVGPRSEQLP